MQNKQKNQNRSHKNVNVALKKLMHVCFFVDCDIDMEMYFE